MSSVAILPRWYILVQRSGLCLMSMVFSLTWMEGMDGMFVGVVRMDGFVLGVLNRPLPCGCLFWFLPLRLFRGAGSASSSGFRLRRHWM